MTVLMRSAPSPLPIFRYTFPFACVRFEQKVIYLLKWSPAVVHVLTTQYGVAAARLAPCGDGPYAPVASNDTEDGRFQNRPVELVKQ